MHWLLARLAWSAIDARAFRDHERALLDLLDDASEQLEPELLVTIAELKMLAADPEEVAWGERAVNATIGTPHAVRARVNLGSSLTNEPGRRHEGRAMLRQVVGEAGGDSFTRVRALNNLLCETVYAEPPSTVLPFVDQFERLITETSQVPSFGEQVVLFRQQCAERLGDLEFAKAAMAWFGPIEPAHTGCLAAAVSLLELDAGSAGAMCDAVQQVAARKP